MSTVLAGAPSTETWARPDQASLEPIQLTPVPVKVKVARSPADMLMVAREPLFEAAILTYQDPTSCTCGLDSSNRVTLPDPAVEVGVGVFAVGVTVGEGVGVAVAVDDGEAVCVFVGARVPVGVAEGGVVRVGLGATGVPPLMMSKASIQIQLPPDEALRVPRT